MKFQVVIKFDKDLPKIAEILHEVQDISGLDIHNEDYFLSHPRLKNFVYLDYYPDQQQIGIRSVIYRQFYLRAVVVQSLLNLGGDLLHEYDFPKWSRKKLDDIRWWEFPRL